MLTLRLKIKVNVMKINQGNFIFSPLWGKTYFRS